MRPRPLPGAPGMAGVYVRVARLFPASQEGPGLSAFSLQPGGSQDRYGLDRSRARSDDLDGWVSSQSSVVSSQFSVLSGQSNREPSAIRRGSTTYKMLERMLNPGG